MATNLNSSSESVELALVAINASTLLSKEKYVLKALFKSVFSLTLSQSLKAVAYGCSLSNRA